MILQGLLQVIQVGGLISCRTADVFMSRQVLGFSKGVFLQPARDHAHPDLFSTNHLGVQLS